MRTPWNHPWMKTFVALLLGAAPAVTTGTPPQWQLLEERCANCHNSIDWAGGLAFDTLSADDIAADAETWEKAVRKLRGRLMPPPGEPQPDQQNTRFLRLLDGRRARSAPPPPSRTRVMSGCIA